MPKSKKEPEKTKNVESSGLEAMLLAAADALRNSIDTAEYRYGHVLISGCYVGAEAAADDGEPFEVKTKQLIATLREQQAAAAKMDAPIPADNAFRCKRALLADPPYRPSFWPVATSVFASQT